MESYFTNLDFLKQGVPFPETKKQHFGVFGRVFGRESRANLTRFNQLEIKIFTAEMLGSDPNIENVGKTLEVFTIKNDPNAKESFLGRPTFLGTATWPVGALPPGAEATWQRSKTFVPGEFLPQKNDPKSMDFPGSLNRWDRYHIMPQLAVYTTYIIYTTYIYCLLGDSIYHRYHQLKGTIETRKIDSRWGHLLED